MDIQRHTKISCIVKTPFPSSSSPVLNGSQNNLVTLAEADSLKWLVDGGGCNSGWSDVRSDVMSATGGEARRQLSGEVYGELWLVRNTQAKSWKY